MILEADFYGGSKATSFSSGNILLLKSSKRFQLFDPQPGGVKKVLLPDARTLELGGPRFCIANIHTTAVDFSLRTAGDVLISTMFNETAAVLSLADNTTLDGIWLLSDLGRIDFI